MTHWYNLHTVMGLIAYSGTTFGGVDKVGCSAEKRRKVEKPD